MTGPELSRAESGATASGATASGATASEAAAGTTAEPTASAAAWPTAGAAKASAAGSAADHLVIDRSFAMEQLYALRSEVSAHASARGVSGDQLDCLLIVAGELASNAVQHGGGAGRLRLWAGDHQVVCEVSDAGPGGVPPGGWRVPPDPTALGGRGLWLCYRLADALDVVSTPAGTTVTAKFAADGADVG